MWELGKKTHYLDGFRLPRTPCSSCCVLVAIYTSSWLFEASKHFLYIMGKGGTWFAPLSCQRSRKVGSDWAWFAWAAGNPGEDG